MTEIEFKTDVNTVLELLDFCQGNNLESYVENFLDGCTARDMVRDEVLDLLHYCDEGNFNIAKSTMLRAPEFVDDYYYVIDGYGNFKEVNEDDIECIKFDIIRDESYVFDDEESYYSDEEFCDGEESFVVI